MQEKSLIVGRKEASRQLGVSIRTLDRYVKSGKLPSQEIDGRIWINIEDLKNFKKNKKTVYRHSVGDSGISKTKSPPSVYRQTVDKQVDKTVVNPLQNLSTPDRGLENKVLELKKQLTENNELHQIKEKNLFSQIETVKENLYTTDKTLKYEKIKKGIYIFIILLLIALQPLWLFLFYKS